MKKMEDNQKRKKKPRKGIMVCPNPLALAPSSAMSASPSSLIPPSIHGSVAAESIKKESSIDYPASVGLCSDVWDEVENQKYRFKEDIRQKALELVDILLSHYHVQAKGVYVVGSMCSNQYTDDADVDIHIQVDLPQETADALNKIRKIQQEELFKGQDLMVGGTHPLEFYFQSNKYADMGSCGCYDLMNQEWLSGPQIVGLEYDPYENYEESWDEAFQFGVRVQEALFSIHKNLYKRSAILEQASRRNVYSDEQMLSVIQRRLEEVKDDLVDNMRVVAELKDEMVKVRRRVGLNPSNEKEAEEMRTNKEWLTANSTFKFLQRLNVIDSCWGIAEIYKALQNGDIDGDDAIWSLNKVV